MINSQHGAPDATDVEIAGRIVDAMLIKGMTREQLSDKTGISYGTLRRSLNGTRSFSFLEFARVANALGVSKRALLTDELAGRTLAA